MESWIVEPRDPLIARDGRPAVPGESISTLSFPHPSVIAGATRTRLASGRGTFNLDAEYLDELKAVEVHGPLLARLSDDGSVQTWFFPAPRDAVIEALESEEKIAVRRAVPRVTPQGAGSDRLDQRGLLPVFPEGESPPGKPPRETPRFWRWAAVERWLTGQNPLSEKPNEGLGIPGPLRETRTHLALKEDERVGMEGMLFATSGLRFLDDRERPRLSPRTLAVGLRYAPHEIGGRPMALIPDMMAPLGGERRLANWRPCPTPWPEIPPKVREGVRKSRRARVVLVTPGIFSDGAIPGWSGGQWPGGGKVHATVAAACVSRPEIISGWDLAVGNKPGRASGRPKPTRRMAPAGSVYFVRLDGDSGAIDAWIDSTWLRPVSDDAQDRADGFGLALIGTWEE
jgi:CRISPR-associated protein Cmr3